MLGVRPAHSASQRAKRLRRQDSPLPRLAQALCVSSTNRTQDQAREMPPKKRARGSARAERLAEPDPAVVLCYGDSNTHGADSESGTRLPLSSRWTTYLQDALGDEVTVVPEGLNGRTTVIDDPQENPDFAGLGGEGMNGRRFLLPCLHSHKPVAVVVLALGCNDLKARHNCDPTDIAAGMAALISDVRKSNAGNQDSGEPPAIVVVSPPLTRETPTCVAWGFKGCTAKSKGTIEKYRELCKEQKVPFVDLSTVATVGSDGIHFPASAGQAIGAAVAKAVAGVLELDLE